VVTPFFFAASLGAIASGAVRTDGPAGSALTGTPFALAAVILVPLVAYLMWRSKFKFYRVLTVAAAGSLVLAWGFAQSPYLLPGNLTIAEAAAPRSTEVLLVIVTLGVVLVIVPAMGSCTTWTSAEPSRHRNHDRAGWCENGCSPFAVRSHEGLGK
jgi:cytochrome bd-type quinol oxidase subunit 2